MYRVRLPYIDNARAIYFTLAVNIWVIFLIYWPHGVTYADVLWDSLVCAAVTTIIDMWLVYGRLEGMRVAGTIPQEVPESRFMQRLPQNPVALGAVYTVVFAALTVGCNAALLRFFGIRDMDFMPWAVYKLAYATLLSIIIVEYCTFRYIQPDWATGGQGASDAAEKVMPARPVRNPLPNIGVFKAMFGAVTVNIAMNIIIGSLLGGVTVGVDGSVVILPITAKGIPITGLVFGFVVGVLVTNGVVTTMNAIISASPPAMLERAVVDRRIAWMPKGRLALTCLVCACVMVFSAVALPAILAFFGIPYLNFYQFTVFITIYAALIGRPLSSLLTCRCMQADYIKYALRCRATV